MAINSTAGDANANSYVSVAEADAYHVLRMHNAEWAAAITTDKEATLVWATRLLERLGWRGAKSTAAQALRWPRVDILNEEGYAYSITVVPAIIKEATSELALYLVKEDRTEDSGSIGISRFSAGSLSVEFKKDSTTKALPSGVLTMLSHLLWSVPYSGMSRLVRS